MIRGCFPGTYFFHASIKSRKKFFRVRRCRSRKALAMRRSISAVLVLAYTKRRKSAKSQCHRWGGNV